RREAVELPRGPLEAPVPVAAVGRRRGPRACGRLRRGRVGPLARAGRRWGTGRRGGPGERAGSAPRASGGGCAEDGERGGAWQSRGRRGPGERESAPPQSTPGWGAPAAKGRGA